MKKAAQYFALALLILLGGIAVLTFLAPRFGWRTDAVMSGSMEPRLKVGGLAVTRPVEPEEVKVGDTILFHSPLGGTLTSHRVIAILQTSSLHFRTKGDANEDADPFIVPAENVVGRVWLHIPYFGYVAQFVKSRLGLLLTLYLPGLIIVILEAISIWHVLDEQEIEKKGRAHRTNR
jgi:signal peptidase